MSATPQINIKPYRTILEALLANSSPAKLSGMLANAASNLDDPELRTVIKKYIDVLNYMITHTHAPNITISTHHRFEEVEKMMQYVEDVIDANQSAWQLIAANNGWGNGSTHNELLEWATDEFGVKALVIAHSNALVDEDSYWIVWDETGHAKDRSISWTNGSKEISEGAGPLLFDCPIYFFELVPKVLNKKWRTECIERSRTLA